MKLKKKKILVEWFFLKKVIIDCVIINTNECILALENIKFDFGLKKKKSEKGTEKVF